MEKEIHKKNIDFIESFLMKKDFSWIDYGKSIKIRYFSKGGGTYIYLIKNNNRKYLARINFYSLKNKWKTKRQEYKILRLIENLKIAPKIYLLNEKNSLGQDFVIVDYVKGREIKDFKKEDVAGLASILRTLHQFNIIYDKKEELP